MERVARAPGRVNLIGEHTDHAGGLVLPVAIDRDLRLRFTPRDDRTVVVRSLARPGQEARCDPAEEASTVPGDWRSYVRGVAALLAEEGVLRRGIDGVIEGDLPERVGLSSSAALEVAVALAILDANDAEMEPLRLAELCREAERRYAGVSCGILDQAAVLLGREDAAIRIDCSGPKVTLVPLPDPAPEIVVVDTGVPRSLAASPYNDRVRECRQAMKAAEPSLLPGTLARRRRHVESENRRVDLAVEALAAGDLESLGRLLDESHASLRDDFEVSWPEADRAVETARQEGAMGARMLGGGFGGSVLALFAPGTADAFAARPEATRLRPGRGAEVLGQSSSGSS